MEAMPSFAVIERNVDAGLGAGEEKPSTHRILADDPREVVTQNAVSDLLPGLAVVGCFVEIGSEVVRLVARSREVGGRWIVMRGVDDRDHGPLGQVGWRDVLPGRAVVL